MCDYKKYLITMEIPDHHGKYRPPWEISGQYSLCEVAYVIPSNIHHYPHPTSHPIYMEPNLDIVIIECNLRAEYVINGMFDVSILGISSHHEAISLNRTHTYIYVHMHTHTCTHIMIHTCKGYTHKHNHTHIHTHIQVTH